MKRINNPKFVSISEAMRLSKGNTLDGLERIYVEKVYEYKTGTHPRHGDWTVQNMLVSQDDDKTMMAVWGFPDLSHIEGGEINVESTIGGNDKCYGITTDEDDKGQFRLKVRPGIIDDLRDRASPEKQRHNIEAHDKSRGASQTRSDDRRGDDRRSSGSRPPQSDRNRDEGSREDRRTADDGRQRSRDQADVKRPVHGATVGMAINQACAIALSVKPTMDDIRSPRFFNDVMFIASNLIRVSRKLESGSLSPTPSQMQASRSEPDRDTGDENVGSDRGEARPAREERPASREVNEPSKQEQGPLVDEGMSDDDIPF